MPQEASDRAIEFPLDAEGFVPELGVTAIEIREKQTSDYYVDFLGARPGDTLEFFTLDGAVASPTGTVERVIQSDSEDDIKLTDGRLLEFAMRGPPPPIMVIRVTEKPDAGAAAADAGIGLSEEEEDEVARQTEILELLSNVLPSATFEVVPKAERSYPDSMQREEMFQDLLLEITAKQRTNPRRIRFIEREVDLAVSLKNKSIKRNSGGQIIGPISSLMTTIEEVINASPVAMPAAIPIVAAARVINLDKMDTTLSYKETDVAPRVLDEVELGLEETAKMYLEGALPATVGTGFAGYLYDLLGRGQQVLQGPFAQDWKEDQDVIRTAGFEARVEGLSTDLPDPGAKEPVDLTLEYLISNVMDRSVRVVADARVKDPSKVSGYLILPSKAAMILRPTRRSCNLPTMIQASENLASDNLPTILETVTNLNTTDVGDPLHTFTLVNEGSAGALVELWLSSVLKYAIHPIDALAPRSPELLELLDTFSLAESDMSGPVAALIWDFVSKSQRLWKKILVDRRKEIQAALNAEKPRSFQSADEPIWAALRAAEPLKELIADISRRNPTIAGSPTLLTASLLVEAQGDALPIVWSILSSPEAARTDPVLAAAALAASRANILIRAVLRNKALLALKATPEINTCPHADQLEAVRNVTDLVQRSRLLRNFIETYQGPRSGDWITCTLCKQNCVCFHELMELEALAQPARMEAIQKQILIKFGGERYEGKIVCKNCGQALQDIDYDDHVEFDDAGRPIVSASVLTAEQLEEPTEDTWSRAIAELAPPTIQFATVSQRYLSDILRVMMDRGGLQMDPSVIRQIVRNADLYVSARAPTEEQFAKITAAASKKASTKIKLTSDVASRVPTYAATLDIFRVSALMALVAIAIQSADPPVTVTTTEALCPFSRAGYPLIPDQDPMESGPLKYISCVTAYIQKQEAPWNNMAWTVEAKPEPRKKAALKLAVSAIQFILDKGLSFSTEIRQALTKVATDVIGIKQRELVSVTDQLPVGFLPEPFPPRMARPSVERNPVPAIIDALTTGLSVKDMIPPLATALKQQAIAIVGELHEAVVEGQPPVVFRDIASLQGAPEQAQLLAARSLLRGAIPTVVNAGTHLWPVFATPLPEIIEQSVDEGIFFKLFLKYCYRGAQVGELHEFSVGNECRQCGLALGKPLDLIDFSTEGAGILAAQEGPLKIEITPAEFSALSETVRRKKILVEVRHGGRESWRTGLAAVVARLNPASEIRTLLSDVLVSEESDRLTLWTPLTLHMDELIEDITTKLDAKRASVLAVFNTMTEDPFIEGPRALQEYWCSKARSASTNYAVLSIPKSMSKQLSKLHTELLNKLVATNSQWYAGTVTDGMRTILGQVASQLGPALSAWIQNIRPDASSDLWTLEEAQIVLRTIVLTVWSNAITTSSALYTSFESPAAREQTAQGVLNWTWALMMHAKLQFMRYSKDTIKRILQDRAGLERDTIVEEFHSIKDDDERAAALLQKQFRIGRWAGGKNLQKYDPETYEFENEQRKRMGIMEPLAEAIGAPPGPAAEDFGLGGPAGPEDGYAVDQGEDGADY